MSCLLFLLENHCEVIKKNKSTSLEILYQNKHLDIIKNL